MNIVKNKQREEALTACLDARNYSFKISNRELFTHRQDMLKVDAIDTYPKGAAICHTRIARALTCHVFYLDCVDQF